MALVAPARLSFDLALAAGEQRVFIEFARLSSGDATLVVESVEFRWIPAGLLAIGSNEFAEFGRLSVCHITVDLLSIIQF